ncbi:MAG: hypothetical protein PHI35_01815 [Victivallaceae bacterium]|nr:hypothetical protein [Victivallaceae bacterium]
MSTVTRNIIVTLVLAVFGTAFIWWMNSEFVAGGLVRNLFCAVPDLDRAMGDVAPGSPQSLAAQDALFGQISMLIFSAVTVLQFFAFGTAWMVLVAIKRSGDAPSLKLKRLENADIFFDVPLYVGLFGTVSAFLVMSFSPQSSRIIAYSSTLIGIIFGLVLRVVLLFPLRQKLLRLAAQNKDKTK